MNPDLWHSHGADRCDPPCSALESEGTCSALDVRHTCSALEVELSPLGDCYAQWPFWLRRSAARLAHPLHRVEDDPQLHGHGGGEHRLAPAEYGIEAAVDRARIAAGLESIAAQHGWLWMIPTCRDPNVATCDLPPRAAVWFEPSSPMLHLPVTAGRSQVASVQLAGTGRGPIFGRGDT